MASTSVSARLDAGLVTRLRRLSARDRVPLSQLVERYLEEAVRAEELPGIVFRSGPAGRRAGLIGGPDVWEVVRDVQAAEAAGAADPVRHVTETTDVSDSEVRLAVAYATSYADEVAARIASEAELVERLAAAIR